MRIKSKWLKLPVNYFELSRTQELVKLLGPGAEVYPVRIWCHMGKHELGNDLMLPDAQVEAIAGWTGAPGALIGAFLAVKLLVRAKEGFEVHDWNDFSPRWREKRELCRARQRRFRARQLAAKSCNALLSRVTHEIPQNNADLEKSKHSNEEFTPRNALHEEPQLLLLNNTVHSNIKHTEGSVRGDETLTTPAKPAKTDKSTKTDLPAELAPNAEEVHHWLEYKKERGQGYKTKGLRALFTRLINIPAEHRKEAILNSMANNWAGIFWNGAGGNHARTGTGEKRIAGTAGFQRGKYDDVSK